MIYCVTIYNEVTKDFEDYEFVNYIQYANFRDNLKSYETIFSIHRIIEGECLK